VLVENLSDLVGGIFGVTSEASDYRLEILKCNLTLLRGVRLAHNLNYLFECGWLTGRRNSKELLDLLLNLHDVTTVVYNLLYFFFCLLGTCP
jgi:hypothetical protein